MRLKPQKQLQSKNPFTEVNGNTISSLVLALPSVLTDGLIKQLNELALAAFLNLYEKRIFQKFP